MLLQRNNQWNVCLFIILFLLVWAYFCNKLDEFSCEHACVFALNTAQVFFSKHKLYKFLFLVYINQIKKLKNMLNLAATNSKISEHIISKTQKFIAQILVFKLYFIYFIYP